MSAQVEWYSTCIISEPVLIVAVVANQSHLVILLGCSVLQKYNFLADSGSLHVQQLSQFITKKNHV
jgi:hypothetical protein